MGADAVVASNGELAKAEHRSSCSEFNIKGDDDEDAEKVEDGEVTEGMDTSDRTPDATVEDLDCAILTISAALLPSRSGQKSSDSDLVLALLDSVCPTCTRGAVPPCGRSPAHDSRTRLRCFRGGGTGASPFFDPAATETSDESVGRRPVWLEIPTEDLETPVDVPPGSSKPSEPSVTESEYGTSPDAVERADGELQYPSVEVCEVSGMPVGTASELTF